MTEALWTQEQVEFLNVHQANHSFHPYTCGNDSRHTPLIATPNGWICKDCDYTQGHAKAALALMTPQPPQSETREEWRVSCEERDQYDAWKPYSSAAISEKLARSRAARYREYSCARNIHIERRTVGPWEVVSE